MANCYIVTYVYKGKDLRDFQASIVVSLDTSNASTMAEQVITKATEHALSNVKNPIHPDTSVAILKLFDLGEEPEPETEPDPETEPNPDPDPDPDPEPEA